LRAVLVDLDDTLYLHERFAECALRAAAREFRRRTGLPAAGFFAEAWRRYALNGSRDNRAFSDIMRAHHCYTPQLEAQVVAAYRRCRPSLRPFPGVVLGLERLRREGVMLGLLTDGQSATQRAKIRAVGLAPFFDEIVVTGDFGSGWAKPARHGFDLLLSRFGCTPREAVMVGDDPRTDGAGARAAGLAMIRVRQGRYRLEEDPASDAEFADVTLALAWILQLRRLGHGSA
jgi:putative hydrolase of the HAD superfamily